MKLNLLKTIVLLIIFSVLMTACVSKHTKTLVLTMEIIPLDGFTEKKLKETIQKRILINFEDAEISKFYFKNNEAAIEISKFPSDEKNTKLLISTLNQNGAGLQFFEAYFANEILPAILDYSKELNLRKYDSLKNDLKNYKQNTLEEKLKYKKDSIALENSHDYPLNGLLDLNSSINEQYNFVIPNVPLLGYCKVSDSTKLFSILDSAQKRNIFPKGLVFKTKRNDNDKNSIEIYTLKLSPPNYKPAMEGDLIETASASLDKEGGYPYISLVFKIGYHEIWRQLTKRCAPQNELESGRFIAIVYDDIVLSAPKVNSEIPNGNSMITGGFSMEEAKKLEVQLNSGNPTCKSKVTHYEFK